MAILALTLLMLGLVGRDPSTASTGPAGPSGVTGAPLSLPGGVEAVWDGEVIHAPSRYAPPGLWTDRSGPGPIGGR